MNVGDIIEFESGDAHLLGAITRDLGQKFIVVTEEGDEMRPSGDNVTRQIGRSVDGSASKNSIQYELDKLREQIEAAAEGLDMEFIWEFVREDFETVTAEELAGLYLESTAITDVMGVHRRLREDLLHFKQGREGFEPRSPEQVDQLRRQQEAEQKERQRRQDFIDGVVEILQIEDEEADEGDEAGEGEEAGDETEDTRDTEDTEPGRTQLARQKMKDTDFRAFAKTLQHYAIHQQDSPEREAALELMEEIEEAWGDEIPGNYEAKAFNLMVDMGLWDQHENLWVHRYNLGGGPDEEVRKAAEQTVESGWEPESWREDVTDRFSFSIDDASTRDIDDALSCRKLEDGRWEVGVHVADPDAHLETGGPLDKYARKRGTSVYLPERTYNMFPRTFAERAASLVAGELRPAVTTFLYFDEDTLELADWEIVPSAVEVDHRLTYEEADALMGDDASPALEALREKVAGQGGADELMRLSETLLKLRDLADQQRQDRLDQGALSIDLPDPKFDIEWVDGTPQVSCRIVNDNSDAGDLVSEFMVQAGHAAARMAWLKDLPVIFRSQDPPDRELYDDQVMDTPEGIPRQFAVLRKLRPGNLSTEPSEHFGLGLPVYTQATSPIRRYGDLICQRQLKAHLTDRPLPYSPSDIVELLAVVEQTASEAGRAQGATTRYWTHEYLRQRMDDGPLEATIVDHRNDEGTRASVWLHEVAYKASARLRTTVPVGEKTEIVVADAKPRQGQLSLKQA